MILPFAGANIPGLKTEIKCFVRFILENIVHETVILSSGLPVVGLDICSVADNRFGNLRKG